MPAAPVPSLDGIRPELHPNLYSLWELSRSGRRPDETEASQEWIRLLLSEVGLFFFCPWAQSRRRAIPDRQYLFS